MMTFEHGNAACTGSQMLVDMTPARNGGKGTVRFAIRPQGEVGTDACGHGFEECGEMSITLTPTNVAHVLAVLRGREDPVMGTRGVRSCMDEGSTLFMDRADPVGVEVHIRMKMEEGTAHGRFTLTPTEALALEVALSAAMGRVAFG